MPINLKYGQQAVARGFLTPQRLQQVLTKQRQLAEQGKKVSLRMILEKSKLLSPDQLATIDRDLNIKVVKKQTGKVDRPGPQRAAAPQRPAPGARPAGPMGAQDFAGEAVPQFSGMTGADPDATVFEPPPPDMQQRIKAERDKAKQAARAKQDAEAAAFFQQNDQSPFGGDPFGGDAMAPEPFGNEMQPEPFGGGEMQPEPMGGFNEMQPEPFGGGDLQPAPMDAFGDEGGGGFGHDPFAGEAAEPELQRMDSSPKLESLPAEYQGFASPDDEELPTLNTGFESENLAPPPQPGYGRPAAQAPRQPAFAPQPAQDDLAPASGGDFDSFGNDIMSPDDLESGAIGSAAGTKPLGSSPDMDRTMFSPPPPSMPSPRQKTGAMDRTVFSPRPPEFGGRTPEPEPEPAGDDWGEAEAPAMAGFDEEPAPADANMDATMFSPPPPDLAARGGAQKKPAGRARGDDDFGNIELPTGKRMDDVPTSPSKGDEVHPLRRGVTSGQHKAPSRPVPEPQDEMVSDELPGESVTAPEIPEETPQEPVQRGKSGKLPGKSVKAVASEDATGPAGKGKLPKKKVSEKVRAEEAPAGEEKPKKKSSRVALVFVFLLLIVLAVLVLPVVLYEQVEQVRPLRDHPQATRYYDYVEKVYIDIRKLAGLDAGAKKPATNAPAIPEANAPTETPAENTAPNNGG